MNTIPPLSCGMRYGRTATGEMVCTGAMMGRANWIKDPAAPVALNLRRLPLNSGGYDQGGAYWGLGQPMYRATGEGVEMFVRAKNRAEAMRQIVERVPGARFRCGRNLQAIQRAAELAAQI